MAVTVQEPLNAADSQWNMACATISRAVSEMCRAPEEIVESLVSAVPERDLSSPAVRRSLVAATDTSLRVVGRALRDGTRPTKRDSESVDRVLAMLVQHGVPLRAVMAVCGAGFRYMAMALGRTEAVSESTRVAVLHTLVGDLYSPALRRISSVYVEKSRHLEDAGRTPVVDLTDGLISGSSHRVVQLLAERAGMTVAVRYTVIALAFPRDVNAEEDTRRGNDEQQLRLMRFLDFDPSTRMAMLGPSGGILLVPDERTAPDVDDVIARLTNECGSGVTAVSDLVAVGGIPDATAHVTRLLSIVQGLGRGPGHYPAYGLAVESQILIPGFARDQLARVLDSLGDTPDLIDTLRMYVDEELNRSRTARKLYIHPNTLDLRFKRIHTLTGLSPVVHSELCALRYALMAYDLQTTSTMTLSGVTR